MTIVIQKKIPTIVAKELQLRLRAITLDYGIYSIPESDTDIQYATNLAKAILDYKENKITFKDLDEIAQLNGGKYQPLNAIEGGIDYSLHATYQQILGDKDLDSDISDNIQEEISSIIEDTKLPAHIGKGMQLHIELLLTYCEHWNKSGSNSDVQHAQNIAKALSDYRDCKISFREVDNIARNNGINEPIPNLINEGIDFSIIATFQQVMAITNADINAELRGYRFDGTPAHPELFKLDIDKFTNKNEGQFKYASPKVGGKQIVYCFSNQERDEEDGDFWIELRTRLLMDTMRSPFEIKVITKDGRLLELENNGIRLSRLMWLCDKDNEYEMAIIDKNRMIEQKILESSEIEAFKSYTRAFIEALEGQNEYLDDLNNLQGNKKKKGCVGILLLPIIAIFALGIFLFS